MERIWASLTAGSSAVLVLASMALLPGRAFSSGARAAPEFSLTIQDLRAMTGALPSTVQGRILADPRSFLHLLSQVLDEPPDLLILVDKKHPLPADYVPPDLVSLKGFPLKVAWPNLMLRRAIMPAVLEMANAARADGVALTFSSAYRSYEYQRGVFEREVKMYGRETAERESAQPGLSQHQLGTAIDFGTISDDYEATREGKWVAAHAWEYGFSLSYPEGYEEVTGYRHESWHYRYITRIGTLAQREFFNGVQQYFLEFLNDNRVILEHMRAKK